jgi:hypothetical protein
MSKGSMFFVAVGGVIAIALAAGCTVSATASPAYANCTQDPSLNCQAGGAGWRCAAGTNPEDEVANLSCSIPVADGSYDDFCCIAWTYGSTCAPDPNIICPNAYSYGYSCLAGDDPTTYDPTLNCSSPVPDPVNGSRNDYCCL